MPDLMTWFEMAQASGAASVYLFEDRCTPVQHRRSKCRKCIQVCPSEAISLHDRKITIDRALCCGCTACSTICPTEAIVALNPVSDALARDALEAMKENNAQAVIACERVAVRENPKERQFAQVPCLCRVHESLLLDLAARGAREVHLIDGGCKNCKYRKCDRVTRDVVKTANQMLKAVGSSVSVQRAGTFPECVKTAVSKGVGERRREAFSQARTSAAGSIGRAVKFLARKEKQSNSTTAAIVDALGVGLEEKAPNLPKRQEKLVNSLFEIGLQNGKDFSQKSRSGASGTTGSSGAFETSESSGAAEATNSASSSTTSEATNTIDTRFFGTLTYDTNKCTECGICSAVCRHRALVRSKRKTEDGKNVFLEFTPSLCTQCRLCEDACYRGNMSVSSSVNLDSLFSFEPTLIVIDD